MKIIFATNNLHKLSEVRKAVPNDFTIVSLQEMGFFDDIPEPHDTLEDNALEKANVIYEKFGLNCFSEDTGLEIVALNGEPGVYSARYAGTQRSSSDNIDLVLQKLSQQTNRKAQFRTVIALIWNNKRYLFEGIAPGTITNAPSGSEGFGYDPIFVPDGHHKTFAQLSATEKNQLSHRGKAVRKLLTFLHDQSNEV